MDTCPTVPSTLLSQVRSVCPTMVLASGSPNRRRLLESAGVNVVVRPQDIWEICGETEPSLVVKTLSKQKIDSYMASSSFDTSLPAIAVDTLVCLEGALLGKPQDEDDARSMLSRLSGAWHEVYSGLSVYNPKDGCMSVICDVTRVHFSNLKDGLLDWYLKTGDWKAAAGAYKIQENGYRLIDEISGSYSNIIGLPLERLVSILS